MRDEIEALVKKSNLAYLHNAQLTPYTLRKAVSATTHGADAGSEFIGCLAGNTELKAGTEGLLYRSHKYTFDKYVWSVELEAQVPAADARKIYVGSYFQFLTVHALASGNRVLAESFHSTAAN